MVRGMDRHRGPTHEPSADRLADRLADRPATPADPTIGAARARVADLLEGFSHVNLSTLVVAPPDAARMAARDRARAAASVAGRGPLLREATEAARVTTMQAFARSGFSGTWAATDMSVSVVNANDRVAAAAALEEAAMAAVVEDLVDDDTLDDLRATWDGLASLRGIPSPGALSSLAVPAAVAIRGPLQVTILAGFVMLLVVVGLAVGLPDAVVLVGSGLALLAGLAWRRRTADQ
jgi:hypothetical protein